MGLKYQRNILLASLCMIYCVITQASPVVPNNISKTKQNLIALEQKIQNMQKRLSQTEDKQTLIQKEVTDTENRIGTTRTKLQTIQGQCTNKQREITQLETQLQPIDAQYRRLQATLSNIIVARYKKADKKAMIGLLQQEKPEKISRLWIYYHYVLRSNQRLIAELQTTRQTLIAKKAALDRELTVLATIKQQLAVTQEKLTAELRYRTALIQTLNQEIRQTKQSIETFRQSQANLSRLLTTLNQQSVLQTRHPLSQMKHKLIKPVQASSSEQNMNQGLLFSAPEGATVQAVFPGKVVFSDWLNAYGLLVIIDHGWGFMTLYANNQVLFKHKGEVVSQGENIANVGHSGAFRQNGLYFEIRHRGKTVPPQQWLK